MGCGSSDVIDTTTSMEISCHCGQVVYKTRESVPRMHYECACRDCAERGEWLAFNGAQG